MSRFCSVFTVAMQLGKCLPLDDKVYLYICCNIDILSLSLSLSLTLSLTQKMSYYSQVLPLVFQWSLCHHFVVRIYAAGSVLEMWRECKNLEFDSQQYSTISSLEQFIPFIENYRLIIEVDYTSILHLFIHSSIYPFIHLSIHPFIHSSIYPFIHSSIPWSPSII